MIRRPPRSTQSRSSAASDVYKRQIAATALGALAPSIHWVTGTQILARGCATGMTLLLVIFAAEELPPKSRAYGVSILVLLAGLVRGWSYGCYRLLALLNGAGASCMASPRSSCRSPFGRQEICQRPGGSTGSIIDRYVNRWQSLRTTHNCAIGLSLIHI